MDRHQWVKQDQDADHHPHPARRVLLVGGQTLVGSAEAYDQAQEDEESVPSVTVEGQEEHACRDQCGEIQAETAHRHLGLSMLMAPPPGVAQARLPVQRAW